MRRIMLLLAVAALMAVMMVASAVPAFARWEANGCKTGHDLLPTYIGNGTWDFADKNQDGFVCVDQTRANRNAGWLYDNPL